MIKERIDNLVDDISVIDPDDLFQYLIDQGNKFRDIPDWASDANRVPGCMSRLWVKHEVIHRGLRFQTCSDSLIVDGAARIVTDIASGIPLDQARLEADELDRLPQILHLSMQRRNGMSNLINRVKQIIRQS